jgi:hypothetical protein
MVACQCVYRATRPYFNSYSKDRPGERIILNEYFNTDSLKNLPSQTHCSFKILHSQRKS